MVRLLIIISKVKASCFIYRTLLYSTMLLLLALPFTCEGQIRQVIQFIDFETTNISILSESIDECDLPNSPQDDGIFGVNGGRFEIHDSEGTCCPNALSQGLNNNFVIFSIDVIAASYCDVIISIQHGAEGTNFACDNNPCAGFTGVDEYRIDVDFGLGFQALGEYCGDQPSQSGAFSISVDNLEPGLIIFQITGGVPSENSTYWLDNIIIEGLPKSLLSAQFLNPPEELCEGQDILVLNVVPTDGSNYEWVGPNGTIINDSPNLVFPDLITPADEGIYSVTVTEAGGCTSTADVSINVITINEKPNIFTFSSLEFTYCENETLILPDAADDGTLGTWNPPSPVDLSSHGDSLALIFTPDNDPTTSDTLIIRIDTIPIMGSNIADMDICVDDNNAVLDLVDIFGLNPESVLNIFAFGVGFDNEDQMRNINVSDFPIGPYIVTFFPMPNGDCIGNPEIVTVNFDKVDIGQDAILQICENDFGFYDFESLISSDNNESSWVDISGSGVDLSFPDGVTLDQLTSGTYEYLYIVDQPTICGTQVIDTSTLTVEVFPVVGLEVDSETVELCGGSDGVRLDFIFSEPGADYTVNLILNSDLGIEFLEPAELEEKSHMFCRPFFDHR